MSATEVKLFGKWTYEDVMLSDLSRCAAQSTEDVRGFSGTIEVTRGRQTDTARQIVTGRNLALSLYPWVRIAKFWNASLPEILVVRALALSFLDGLFLRCGNLEGLCEIC